MSKTITANISQDRKSCSCQTTNKQKWGRRDLLTFCFEELSEVKVAAHCLQMLLSRSSLSSRFPASSLPRLGLQAHIYITSTASDLCAHMCAVRKEVCIFDVLQISFSDSRPSGRTTWDHFKGRLRFLSPEKYFLQIWGKLPVKGV